MATVMNNAMLDAILAEVRPLIGRGKVADYIPALARVSGEKLGVAICTVDGQHYSAGDAHERFSIQSISKVLSLVVAMNHYQEEEIWQRVGKDPSGQPFNSLLQLEIEQGKPRNPFINAGALVVCDMLQSRLSAPRQRMLEIVRRLSGVGDIAYDPVVARSEFDHSARNAAIAWLMKSFGNFHNDVATVLQNYFHYCSLEMSCVELARTFLFLADRGIAPHLETPVIAPIQSRQVNALMMTSGMYQNAGEFAWRVGLPAKSGVSGGLWLSSRRRWRLRCGARNSMRRETRWPGIALLENSLKTGKVGILMVPIENLFARLQRSTFRSRFRLGVKNGSIVMIRARKLSTSTRRTLSPVGWPLRKFLTTVSRPDARTSGVYRPACHRDMLSRLFWKWRDPAGPRAQRRRAALRGAGYPSLAGDPDEFAGSRQTVIHRRRYMPDNYSRDMMNRLLIINIIIAETIRTDNHECLHCRFGHSRCFVRNSPCVMRWCCSL